MNCLPYSAIPTDKLELVHKDSSQPSTMPLSTRKGAVEKNNQKSHGIIDNMSLLFSRIYVTFKV